MNRLVALLAGAMLTLSVSSPVAAARDPAQTARRAAEMLKAASQDLVAARSRSNRVAALTRTVRAYEAGLAALREGIRQSAVRESELEQDFATKRQRISKLLGVLATIGRNPAPLLMLHPAGPLGAVRSGMILADVTPALQGEARKLRHKLEELALMRTLQDNARGQLAAGLTGIQQARSALSQAIADRAPPPKRLGAEKARLAALARASVSLRDFAASLARTAPVDERARPPLDFAAARGKLELPAPGTLLRHFMEPDAAGIRHPGLVYAVAPRTLVVSPWTATLRYRGPLLDYGDVIVLEPGEGYLLVLAGLAEVYGEVGDIVARGTPVGLMGGADPSAPEFLADAAKGGGIRRPETLYVELRESGKPIDPTRWFSANRD